MNLINRFYTRLGFNALVSERYDKAEAYFLNIRNRTGGAMGTNHNLGMVYFAAGKFDLAKACFSKEIDNFGPAYSRVKALGDVYYEMGDAKQSLEQYQTALKLASGEQDIVLVKARIDICMDNKRFSDASAASDLCKKGIMAEKSENFSNALSLYADAIKKDPTNIQALNNAGACCERLKDLPKARFYFKKAFELSGLPVAGQNLKKIDNAISKQKDTQK